MLRYSACYGNGRKPGILAKGAAGSSKSISSAWETVIGGSSVNLTGQTVGYFVSACFMHLP